ncbi:MAG TPA: NAD(P)-dependent oxidoreductase [Sphingomicrobium sp.]|nr:NAD(P)-dependent oxidoreductase [Sphingomicrobium sp.]
MLITGSSGFLGRSVVAKCAEAGHKILAVVRPNAPDRDDWPDGLEFVVGDLRQRKDWYHALEGVEAVIHLAAATSGDLPQQFAGTVIATENLLQTLPSTVRRFVHVSSFSVYDFGSMETGSELDERSALEARPDQRDPYTWAKLLQERLVVDHCKNKLSLVVIRPGAIFGPGKHWDFGRALKLRGLDIIFAPFARMRLTNVDNCADAIVRGLECPGGGTFNIVDSDLPTHATYHRLSRLAGASTGRAVYVPWIVVAATGLAIRAVNRLILGGRARLPEILDFPRQQARWKPLRYSNNHAILELGWRPRLSISEGVTRMFADGAPPLPKPDQSVRSSSGARGAKS